MIGRPTPLDTPGEVQVGDGHATGLIALLQSRACHVPTGLPWPVYAPVQTSCGAGDQYRYHRVASRKGGTHHGRPAVQY